MNGPHRFLLCNYFFRGFTWGLLVYAPHFVWLAVLLATKSQAPWYFAGAGYVAIVVYFALTSGVWFACAGVMSVALRAVVRYASALRPHSPRTDKRKWSVLNRCYALMQQPVRPECFAQQNVSKGKVVNWCWLFLAPTLLYGYFIENYSLFIFGRAEGYPFLNPLIPLAGCKPVLWAVAKVGELVRWVTLGSAVVCTPLTPGDARVVYVPPVCHAGDSAIAAGQRVYHALAGIDLPADLASNDLDERFFIKMYNSHNIFMQSRSFLPRGGSCHPPRITSGAGSPGDHRTRGDTPSNPTRKIAVPGSAKATPGHPLDCANMAIQRVYHALNGQDGLSSGRFGGNGRAISKSPLVVVTPETFYPYSLNLHSEQGKLWASAVPENTFMIVGSQLQAPHKFYQAAYLLQNGLIKNYYVKRHCTPFVEKIPKLWKRVTPLRELFLQNAGEFSRGRQTLADGVFKVGEGVRLIPQICSEFFFKTTSRQLWAVCRGQPAGTKQAIVFLINDSWFMGYFQRIMRSLTALKAAYLGVPVIYVGHEGCGWF